MCNIKIYLFISRCFSTIFAVDWVLKILKVLNWLLLFFPQISPVAFIDCQDRRLLLGWQFRLQFLYLSDKSVTGLTEKRFLAFKTLHVLQAFYQIANMLTHLHFHRVLFIRSIGHYTKQFELRSRIYLSWERRWPLQRVSSVNQRPSNYTSTLTPHGQTHCLQCLSRSTFY